MVNLLLSTFLIDRFSDNMFLMEHSKIQQHTLLLFLIWAQFRQMRSYCRRRGSRVGLFLASALLHIVSSGNNAATVHFSQCDKQTAINWRTFGASFLEKHEE